VSIATLDDMKVLYSGFDLTAPSNSVSMTINGPAPTILAMFLNTAIDQQLDRFRADNSREPTDDEVEKIRAWTLSTVRRHRAGRHPQGGPGPEHLHLLDRFSLKVMGDIQESFVRHQVKNFYSVSISGYHIAEAARIRSRSSRSRSRTASRSSRRTSRAACTSTTSRRTCRSSSATAWIRSTR
jgi:methylmalonyl-CoA mutase